MTDQTIPDVTDDDRRRAREWAEGIEANPKSWSLLTRTAARVILNAVPTPARPTLADMTPVARRECQWMQCEVRGDRRIIILVLDDRDHNHAVTLDPYGHTAHCPFESVTPRPDLPPLEWPGDKKPDPALPGGWRLADHKEHGRVIVTNPTPNIDGHVYFVLPVDDPLGYDWNLCFPGELTYIDTDQGAADAVD